MGPEKLVRHMQNPPYTYDEYLICIGLGPSIWSVICKNLSYSGPSYPSSPVFKINTWGFSRGFHSAVESSGNDFELRNQRSSPRNPKETGSAKRLVKNFTLAKFAYTYIYCCSVWGNCPANQQNRITKLQKRAARLILDADLSIPSSDLFKKLKWLPFPKYVEYQQSVTVYKSLNELNPHYMNKLFSYTQENHSYGTRNATSSLLALPKCNKSIGQKCISYSGPKVWNGLTEAIRCAPSLPSFKSRYLKAMYCTTL